MSNHENLTPEVQDYGYLISSDEACDIWWCEGTYKVNCQKQIPKAKASKVMISAAKNEYEPFQIIVHPRHYMRDAIIDVTDLISQFHNGRIAKDKISVMHVMYVYTKVPSDSSAPIGCYPDPLLPYEGSFQVRPNVNHPIWFLVHVPKGIQAGDYLGKVIFKARYWHQEYKPFEKEIELKLHVWDFELPEETHVQSAFGFSPELVKKYHRLDNEIELRKVLDKYYQSFREHRITPYHPMDPIDVKFVRPEGVEHPTPDQIEVKINFDAFDRTAKKYLDEWKFTSFMVSLQGLGGGTFHSRWLGEIAGFKQGTPEHEAIFTRYVKMIQDHLEERGWLSKAYVYWFDEPDPKDYEFVKEGMALIHRAGPKLTRMLTLHREPPPEVLYGYVDLWCPMTPVYDHKRAEECRKRGERFWWYICTAPKAPYVTLFIDHPAIELRIWLWQTWMYKIDGILVWSANYWTSPTAFPHSLQNPYDDPMSYVSGYGRPAGYIAYWGNGDGRFIYPPKKVFESQEKCFEGPVSSIRWEMLREGIEDYEYLWILRELAHQLEARAESDEKILSLLESARKLLQVPPYITFSQKDFTHDPKPLYEYRQKIAETIEKINEVICIYKPSL